MLALENLEETANRDMHLKKLKRRGKKHPVTGPIL